MDQLFLSDGPQGPRNSTAAEMKKKKKACPLHKAPTIARSGVDQMHAAFWISVPYHDTRS